MKDEGVKHAIVAGALGHPKLSDAQRVFLIAVAHLPAEYVDGKPRKGSRGMDRHGRFALHYDYIARALHKSPVNVRKIAQRLAKQGVLDKVNAGTFGRPAAWQALDVRGDTDVPITWRASVPPYGPEAPLTRGDSPSPLTYRTPDEGEWSPTSCAPPAEQSTAEAATRRVFVDARANLPARDQEATG